MKALNVDDSQQPAFVCIKDAKDQTAKYWPTFTKKQQTLAIQLKDLVHSAYFRSNVYLNARDKFISIKVDRPQKADLLQNGDAFNVLKAFMNVNGIGEPIATVNNLLFRIMK